MPLARRWFWTRYSERGYDHVASSHAAKYQRSCAVLLKLFVSGALIVVDHAGFRDRWRTAQRGSEEHGQRCRPVVSGLHPSRRRDIRPGEANTDWIHLWKLHIETQGQNSIACTIAPCSGLIADIASLKSQRRLCVQHPGGQVDVAESKDMQKQSG